MILVAGGQLDFNIGRLLRRMLARRTPCLPLVVGPTLVPRITLDLRTDELRLDGVPVRPTACFMRYDAFLQQQGKTAGAEAVSLNWFHAIKGWELAHDEVKGFNKASFARENTKLQNLYIAKRLGLAVPDTIVTNEFDRAGAALSGTLIQKPVAGGEHTTHLSDLRKSLRGKGAVAAYPRFVQRKLARPEMRIFRIGEQFLAFLLRSDEVDYRVRQDARLAVARPPAALVSKLRALTDELGLDFAAADFMKDARGRYRFLEINTQPMFAAFDDTAGGRLCDAIIDHLS